MVSAIVNALPTRYRTTLIARRVREGMEGVFVLVVTVLVYLWVSIHYTFLPYML